MYYADFNIHQLTVEASKTFVLFITNEVPEVIVPTVCVPTFVNAPVVASCRNIPCAVDGVQVVETVAVPPDRVA